MAKKQTKIRNVLDLPLKAQWPQIGNDKVEELKVELHKFLSPMLLKSLKPPWKEMKRATPIERKARRLHFLESRTPREIEEYKTAVALRKNLFIGINALTRAIEKNSVSCGVLADEVAPKILIKHVIQLATLSKIPMLVLPGLKTVTKNSLGFSAIAIGFKKDVGYNKEICEYLKSLGGDYSADGISDVDANDAKEKIKPVDEPSDKAKNNERMVVHLTRSEPFRRAFQPPASEDQPREVDAVPSIPSLAVDDPNPDAISSLPSNRDEHLGISSMPKLIIANNGIALKRRRDPTPNQTVDSKETESGIKIPKLSLSLAEHRNRYFTPPSVVQIQQNPAKHRKKKKKRKL